MDYDTYLDRQLDKYQQELEMNEEVSDCCGAEIDDDICTECGDECHPIARGEYLYEAEMSYLEDAADAERELKRERDDL